MRALKNRVPETQAAPLEAEDGQPVAAHPGGFGYRADKFVRRHRLAVAAAAAMLLLALAFTAALIFQLHATERARDRAEGVSAFLVDLFQAAAPDRPAGDEPMPAATTPKRRGC